MLWVWGDWPGMRCYERCASGSIGEGSVASYEHESLSKILQSDNPFFNFEKWNGCPRW